MRALDTREGLSLYALDLDDDGHVVVLHLLNVEASWMNFGGLRLCDDGYTQKNLTSTSWPRLPNCKADRNPEGGSHHILALSG